MKFLDLFAGGGGLTRGLLEAGFRPVGAVELGYWEAETYSFNFPWVKVWNKDVKNIHANDILENIGRVEVVVGGPPCEAFTAANAGRFVDPLMRLYEDPRGRLTLHFVRLVGDLEPEVFLMENVVGIIENDLKEALRYEFGRVGYEVKFHVFDAEDFGVASRRRRVFLSNMRLKPKKGKKKVVWDVIGDLPPPDESIPNHTPAALSKKMEEKAWKLRWGQALTYFKGAARIVRNYIKLHPFEEAPVVMGSSRFIHPFEGRLLTPREHARLMGYPDDHIFLGPLERQYNMVGESVPPPLARSLGEAILRKVGV